MQDPAARREITIKHEVEQSCDTRLYHSLQSLFLYLYDKAHNEGRFPLQPTTGRGKAEREVKYLMCQLLFPCSWAGCVLDPVFTDSAAAQQLHWGGSASKTVHHHWLKHVLMQGLKARLCTCPASSPGVGAICKPEGSLQHYKFCTIANSGKNRPYIRLSNTSGNNWQSFNIVPQPLTTPYPVFSVSSPHEVPWISDGEIWWIFGSYLLLESQEGTRAGKRNPAQSCARRTLPYGNVCIHCSLEEILWQLEIFGEKSVSYIFIYKNEFINWTMGMLNTTGTTSSLMWGPTSSTCIFPAWSFLTPVSFSSLRSISSSKSNQVKKRRQTL